MKFTNASLLKVEQKKKEHIKKMAADRRMAQKFFLIQVELQKFKVLRFPVFRQWSHQQQQRLALLQSETDRQSQQIPSASGMYNLFATAPSWKCIIAVLYEMLGVSFINPDHLLFAPCWNLNK